MFERNADDDDDKNKKEVCKEIVIISMIMTMITVIRRRRIMIIRRRRRRRASPPRKRPRGERPRRAAAGLGHPRCKLICPYLALPTQLSSLLDKAKLRGPQTSL